VSKKLFGRSGRKRKWGRSMQIDSWERLQLVVELMKKSLSVDMSMDLNHTEVSGRQTPPLPYDPRTGSSTTIPTPMPSLAEVRVTLSVDETLAWVLPVQFCIDRLLTAEEVVTKLTDALGFLEAWSKVHSDDGREHLRAQCLQDKRPARSLSKYLVQ